MRKRLTSIVLALALVVPALVALAATPAAATMFSNPAGIALNDPNSQSNPNNNAIATPYPSTISVSGLSGTVNHVAVTLNDVSYGHSQDIDVLMVGPGGQSLILVANLGPNSGLTAPAAHSTLTLSDAGVTPPAANLTPWGSTSTFRPVNYGGFNQVWGPPAPAGPYGNPGPAGGGSATFGSIFNGTNPNGLWSLYVITTSGGDGTGAIAGGWSLDVTTAAAAATTTTLSSNTNPSFTTPPGNSVTLTATVKKTSDMSNVNEGTVAFTDGGSPVSGCAAVAVSAGTATCTTIFSTEGAHSMMAAFSGTANVGSSHTAVLTQVVNNHTTVTGSNFCNAGSITLNDFNTSAKATPYPSNVFVSGLPGVVNHVTVTLNNVSYSHSQDIDALLVGPGGQTLILVANLGPSSGTGAAAANATVTFSDAGVVPPMATPWSALSTVKPINYGGFNQTWGTPAPPGPYGDPGTMGTAATLASQFNGINGNGTWSLYVITTAGGDGTGAVAGGWCANITAAASAATTTTLSSDNNPSFITAAGNSVIFTAAVKKASDLSRVNEGTVAFTDGGTPIAGCAAVAVAAGQATCTTTFATEGDHPILAQYNGTMTFGPSSATWQQIVNSHTTVTGNNFCNTGPVALNNPPSNVANATPYPSNIFVTGRPGPLQHLTVTLLDTTYSHSQDIDVLLVGPGGQTLILVANLGPNSGTGAAANHSTLTLDDNGILPPTGQATPWGSNSTFRPVNYGGFNQTWGPPAPPGPYGDPGMTGTGATIGSNFNGTVPNGTWKLYVITTAPGDGTGAIAGGWCLGITSPTPPTLTKSFGAPTIPLNGSTSLTFTVQDPNASASLSGIGFTDTLPAGLVVSTPNGLTGTCGGGAIAATAGSNMVNLSGATLAANASCSFSLNVTGTTPGSKMNSTSTVSSVEGGAGAAASATLAVVAPPVLGKSFGAPSIPVTGSTSLSFTVTNSNSGSWLSGVGFTDTLPAGLVVSTPNGLTGSCGGGTMTAAAGTSSISLSGAALAAGANCTFSVNVTGTAVGTQTNTTSAISSTEGGSGAPATATLKVTAGPVQITKSFGAASVPLNGSTTLTFSITNPAANGTSTGIGFTDTLPAGLVAATPAGLTGSCGGGTIGASAGSNTVTLSGATLAANASCSFSLNVTGTTPGQKNNSVQVSSTEGGMGNTANASVTVVAPPTLTKQFGAATIALNTTTSLMFNLVNPNATTALTGVGFTDTLPAGLVVSTPNGLSGTCGGGSITAAAGSASVTLANATLAAGASCTFSVNVTGISAGAQVNTTSAVSSNEGGSGNPATATVTVAAGPVQITKSFGAASIPLNGAIALSFTITNPAANGTSTGIAFIDSLPAGLAVATPNGLTGSCGGGTITAAAGSTAVNLTGASLAAGASCTFSVIVTGTTPGQKNNSVTVSSANGGTGNTSNANLTILAPPNLTKSFGAAQVPVGGTTTLTFVLNSPNQVGTLSGIGFTDTLPPGLTVSTPSGLSGSCDGGTITAVAGANTVSLTGATLGPLPGPTSNCTFAVDVAAASAGTKVNTTSTVSSNEGGTGTAATATLIVVAPPQIAKSFGAANIAVNGTTTLTFTINNLNVTTSLTGVGFTDTLPAGLVVATPNGLIGTCGGGTITATAASGTVALAGATLAPSSSCTFSVNVTGTTSGIKTNSVTVTSSNGGTGNTAAATLSVALPPRIAKSFGAATIPVNASTSLSFTVTNPNSNFTLSGVGFTDTLPSGLVVATPNGVTGSCGGGSLTAMAGSTTVSLAGASLAGNTTCTFAVNGTGTTAGVKNNSVTVTSGNAGPGTTATATITVLAPPAITKSFGLASISFGGSTTLTFTLTNSNSTNALIGVGFTDTLPTGLVVATPNGLTGSCGGGTITAAAASNSITLAGATIAPSGSCSFSIKVVATAVGTVTNTTSAVTSANGGTGLAATAPLTVTRAPTMTTVTASPTNPSLGSPVTFTATVVPSGPNGSGVNPTGTVSFFLGGQATPVAVVPLSPSGVASFTTSGLGAGPHTVTALYSGDMNFRPSSSTTGAMVTVTCTTTITGGHTGSLVLGPGSTCIIGSGTISGSIIVPKGSALDLEGATVTGSISSDRATFFRMCGTTTNSVTVQNSTGFVLVGDPGDDGCAVNTLHGSLTLLHNTAGVEAIGNHVAGAITASGNSGAGPFPEDTAPEIEGNGP